MDKCKYIDAEQLNAFLQGMEDTPTEDLLSDPSVIGLAQRYVPRDLKDSELALAEAFLLLFQNREVYEFCARILKAYPELTKTPPSHNTQ